MVAIATILLTLDIGASWQVIERNSTELERVVRIFDTLETGRVDREVLPDLIALGNMDGDVVDPDIVG